jgi:cytochrome c-type biogenesis protein CcmE
MKIGGIVSMVAAAGALSAGGYVFLTNSVPYVNVDQAIAQPNSQVHLAGEIQHDTARFDPASGILQFYLKDDVGKVMMVLYTGAKPANFDSAPKVSCSGYYAEGKFHADKMLVKCPSKYESEKGPSPHAAGASNEGA